MFCSAFAFADAPAAWQTRGTDRATELQRLRHVTLMHGGSVVTGDGRHGVAGVVGFAAFTAVAASVGCGRCLGSKSGSAFTDARQCSGRRGAAVR